MIRVLVAALALLPAIACAQAEPAQAAAVNAPTAAPSPDIQRFRIGALEAISLRDGGLHAPNDNSMIAMGRSRAETDAVLTRAGAPTDTLSLSIQSLLVRSGDRLVLFDTGTGAGFSMPGGGKLLASLAAAGVTPDQITDIVISHGHGDHVGGLTTDGALTFPNARVHMSTAEWASMAADTDQAERVALITPKVVAAAPGAQIAPGIRTFAIEGHTPGHIGTEIVSEGQRLIYIGDTAHHYVISVARPDWRIQFDGDAPTAQRSRRALLQRAVDERLTLFAPHFPFPGRGTIRADGEGFAWVPAS